MEPIMASARAYDGLRTFSDIKVLLDQVTTHKGLCDLNDAVDDRYMRSLLIMSDADWYKYTELVASLESQFE